jgi:hypothetical protein
MVKTASSSIASTHGPLRSSYWILSVLSTSGSVGANVVNRPWGPG